MHQEVQNLIVYVDGTSLAVFLIMVIVIKTVLIAKKLMMDVGGFCKKIVLEGVRKTRLISTKK